MQSPGAAAGIRVIRKVLPEHVESHNFFGALQTLNIDREIHGILMFRPLPPQLDELAACDALLPEKDIDCMTPRSLAAVFSGKGRGFAPCTPQACIELLDYYGISLRGKNIVVIGRSLVIGKPLSMLLQNRDATVTMCHTRTSGIEEICRRADILVAAAGKAGLVDACFVQPDQVVIDVGVNAAPGGGICGDVQFDAVSPIVRAISPVPGGVGSVTAAVLCKHILEAAEASLR